MRVECRRAVVRRPGPLLVGVLLAAGLLTACSGAREPGPLSEPAPAQPPAEQDVIPGLWAATGQGQTIGFAVRVQPGAVQDQDFWRFRMSRTDFECRPKPAEEGLRLADCESLPRGVTGFVATVPRNDPGTIRLELASGDDHLRAELKRVPERDEAQKSANVQLAWHRQQSAGCRLNTGIWAADGLVFAPCASGSIELLDANSGELRGVAVLEGARGSEQSAVLEVTARGGLLYAATTASGVVIFDINDAARPKLLGQYFLDNGEGSPQSFTNVHNLTLSPRGDLLFAVNQSHPGTDVRVIDVSDPRRPREAGRYDVRSSRGLFGGAHDIALEQRDGRLIAYLNRLAGGFYVLDASDPARMREIGAVQWPGIFSHSAWPFEAAGRRYVAHTDEGFDQGLTVLDVTNPAAPGVVSRFRSRPGISVHNVRVRDGIAYVSYYLDGLRVIDLRDPRSPREIGHFDTVPAAEESELFQGAWGVHLDGGLVFISDMQAGVFAFRVQVQP